MSRGERVLDDLYIVGGPGISSPGDCMVYLVGLGGGAFALVDAGVGTRTNRILENIRNVGYEPGRIQVLFLTHCHIDHIGGASFFRDRFGVKTIGHELDADAIEQGDRKRIALDFYGVPYKPVKIEVKVRDDTTFRFGDKEFKVLHSPGHTPGSISILTELEGRRVLFGQDVHGPFDPIWESSIEDWRRSMRKLIGLGADVLCEGHYGVIKPKERVREFIRDFMERY